MRIRLLSFMAGLLPVFAVTSSMVIADELVPSSIPAVPSPSPSPASSPAPSPTVSGTVSAPATASPTPSASASPAPIISGTAMPPVIPFEKLLPLLPAAPEGWVAEPPQGSTSETDEFKITTVQRSYFKGSAEKGADENAPTASLSILDFGGNQTYFDTATGAWNFSSETTEGYDKSVDLGGIRGFEHYVKEAKAGSLSVVVGKRFFVQVELTNLDPKELREWFKKIDIKKLNDLK